ncbi:MAG: phage tail tape measure protein [Desulfovibrio sp.]|nr:phage tail tape measure protein [Desulfovibrio sp.]
MNEKLQKLMFSINLIDRVSAPVAKVQKHLSGMAAASERAFTQVGTGAAGIAGAGLSFMGLINPAEQLRQAMGEVASLGVDDSTLKGLSDQALQYSIKYGRAADGFVRSAYDIQSAISGLEGNDLAVFTNAGNVLATATKSDAGTITGYMSTMYGIFEDEANKMGKAQWVERLTGQTAAAVQAFRTDGSQMSAAFTTLGSKATNAGVSIAEQLSVLGKLQQTMSGSEAGTKYKAFLSSAYGAQQKLGLSFVDSNNRLLPMVDIMEKIQNKFGELDAVEQDLLKKAFGTDEAAALVEGLYGKTGELTEKMDMLGKINGMDKATEMASHMVTPLQRIWQGVLGITTALGQSLNPALDPLINGMANAAATMTAWMGKYQNITRWIGYGVLAVFSMTAALGALSVVMGLSKLGMIGLAPAISAARWALALFTKQGLIAKGVMWLLNTAFWANPAVWLVAALVGVVAAVGAVIYWWDDLKAAFLDTSWGKGIMQIIDWLLKGFGMLSDNIGWVVDKVGGFFGFGEDETISSPSLDSGRKMDAVPGGMTTHIANTVAKNRSDSRTIGKQENHFHTNMSNQELEERMWLLGGR